MSDKLLHEMLKDEAYELSFGEVKYMTADAMRHIADEIERDYIPCTEHEAEVEEIVEAQKSYGTTSAHHIMKLWAEKRGIPFDDKQSITEWLDKWFSKRPLFEDGQPVSIGAEAEGGTIGRWLIWSDGNYKLYDNNGYALTDVIQADERVKRPAPKALDADGVEINVWDTVWHVDGSNPWKVVSVDSRGVLVRDETFPYDEGGAMFRGCALTHKEPDSLERLQQFAVDSAAYADGCEQDKFLEIADRLKAIIERGA